MTSLGIHWLAHAVGCDPARLADPLRIADLLCSLADDAGLTVLGEPLVQANATGWVGVVLLAESHASIHTDVERAMAFVDVFSCVAVSTERFGTRVRDALSATDVTSRTVPRGGSDLP